MEVDDGEDGASAGRGEGGDDAPAAHASPFEHAAAPARPASASAITAIVLALGDAASAEQQRGDQARGGAAGGGSTHDAAGAGVEGQQGSGEQAGSGTGSGIEREAFDIIEAALTIISDD